MSNAETQYFKAITLGHFLSELPKSTLPASVASENGAYPFFCSSSVVKYCNTFIQEKPTVLMGTGGVASVNFGNDKFAYSTDTWAFRSNDEEALKTEYIYRALRQKLPKIDYRAFEGSGLKHLRKKDVKNLLIRVPVNKIVKEKILTIFRDLDSAIEKTEALIEKYQQIKAGLMHDLFTRGIGADGKLRPPREQAPELYQETPIGWIPKDWGLDILRSVLIENPTNGIYKSADLIGEGTLMIGQTAFTKERSVDFSLCRKGLIDDAEIKHYSVLENNILITRVFATVNGVGLPTVVPKMYEPAVFESNMMRLKVNVEKISPLILFEWLRNRKIRNLIVSGANASNQVSINQKVLNKLPVPSIDQTEQLEISKKIDSVNKAYTFEISKLVKLKQLKSGVMHDLLTGKVEVTINSAEVANV